MDFLTFVKTQLGTSPAELAGYFSDELATVAASIGIDWMASKDALVFSYDKVVYKTKDGVTGLTKEDKGRIAIIPGIGTFKDKKTNELMAYPIVTFTNTRASYFAESAAAGRKVATKTFHSLAGLYALYEAFNSTGEAPARQKANTVAAEVAAKKRIMLQNRAAAALAHDLHVYNTAQPLSKQNPSQYLAAKSVLTVAIELGLKVSTDTHGPFVTYPLQLNNNTVVGTQRLYDTPFDDGNRKLCTTGAPTNGAYFIIGPHLADVIYICEGLATALSVYAATGKPVAIALYNSNLPLVNAALQRYPKRVVVADNDRTQPEKGNSGMYWAIEAIKLYGGFVFCPRPTIGTDANDVHHYQGLDQLIAQLQNKANYWTQREALAYSGLFNTLH